MKIQTCGSFDVNENEYSLSLCFETHCVTFDGLSKDDLIEIQSCVECLIDSGSETRP